MPMQMPMQVQQGGYYPAGMASYDPMVATSQRLAQMEQSYTPQGYSNPQNMNAQFMGNSYNQQMQPMYPQNQQNPPVDNSLKCRKVTSIDEARSAMIDLDGSMFIFVDSPNGCIYTKQVGLDGTAPVITYTKKDRVEEKPKEETPTFVDTRTFQDFQTQFVEMQKRIQWLEGRVSDESGNESDSAVNANVRRQIKSDATSSLILPAKK